VVVAPHVLMMASRHGIRLGGVGMVDTYIDIVNGKRVEKEIETFDDAMLAWETGQLSGFEVPDYINSRNDAKIAYEAGLLNEAGFRFFDTMQYD